MGHRRAVFRARSAAALAAGALAVAGPRTAAAGRCAPDSDDTRARRAFLAATFDREIRDLDLWSWTWGTIYVAAGATQATLLAFIHDYGVHVDLTVGAISAGVGAASLYALPLRVTLPLRDVRRAWDDGDPCVRLADAEAVLAKAAEREAMSTGWLAHVGNVAVNAAIAGILGFGYRRWTSAALSAGIGLAVGEINLLSQPHRLPGVLDRYRAGHLDARAPSELRWALAPAVGSHAATLSVVLAF